MLLVVAESSGSSPGRQGYKMAVGADGELFGSIGGGVMEVNLVEQARGILSRPHAGGLPPALIEQIHRRDVENASGMICSGRQSVIVRKLTQSDLDTVKIVIDAHDRAGGYTLLITESTFAAGPDVCGTRRMSPGGDRPIEFRRTAGSGFVYSEVIGKRPRLYIIGGGHCALALSELMARLGFHISLFDDRPDLNTIEKNEFADEKRIVESYDQIGELVRNGDDAYVVVMTLGYASDAVVIRQLVDKDFKYFGVLGSKAKMATLFKELIAEGISKERLDLIRTPIGLPINSRTPDEIAVSIAAEIIATKNGA